ncbi:hypothetical protein DV096_16750 [Bradymonadaceae bacterium TMQ3]|nr:hypothetical protein DV096_16750 [Bradymonadaceae bacterium TMQ3]
MWIFAWIYALDTPDTGSDVDPEDDEVEDVFGRDVWAARRATIKAILVLNVAFLIGALGLALNIGMDGNLPGAYVIAIGGLLVFGAPTFALQNEVRLAREQLEAPQLLEGVERRVLKLARKRKGLLRAGELAMATSLNLEGCREVLEHFEALSIARSQVDGDGSLVFIFEEFRESTV